MTPAQILVVDDEEPIVNVLQMLLTDEGHCVTATNDGQQALEMVRSGQQFDLIISDISMDPIDGMEILEGVQRTHPATPVIMLTAYDPGNTIAKALAAGAFAYVRKPFNGDELVQVVRRALVRTG